MNTKLIFASIVFTISLIATACAQNSLPILDQAQTEEASYEIVPNVPVTGVNVGVNAYDYEQEARAYPNQRLHSACVSEDIGRQGACEEQEQNSVSYHTSNLHADTQDYPRQEFHSHCVSEDIHRQNNCMP